MHGAWAVHKEEKITWRQCFFGACTVQKEQKCVGDGACTVLIILKKINKPIIQTNQWLWFSPIIKRHTTIPGNMVLKATHYFVLKRNKKSNIVLYNNGVLFYIDCFYSLLLLLLLLLIIYGFAVVAVATAEPYYKIAAAIVIVDGVAIVIIISVVFIFPVRILLLSFIIIISIVVVVVVVVCICSISRCINNLILVYFMESVAVIK